MTCAKLLYLSRIGEIGLITAAFTVHSRNQKETNFKNKRVLKKSLPYNNYAVKL